MTSRQTFTSGDRTYTVSLDARLRAGRIPQSIVSAQFLDEHTGLTPSVELTAHTKFPKLTPKSTIDGLAGLSGVPERALPQLRTAPYDVDFAVTASRYLPFEQQVHFINQAGFPDAFAQRDLGIVELHRQSVELRGRVVRQTATGIVPVAATVSVTGYWRRIPSATSAPPPAAPDLGSLKPGVYIPRAAAAAQIRRRDFAPTPDVSELLADAPAGVSTWQLSNRAGLAPGQILRIDPGDPERAEYLIVQYVTGSATATQPATVVLQYPGRIDHRPGTRVERITAAAPGPNNALISDAMPGDAVVLAAGLAGLAAATTVEIDDGIAAPEYHTVSLFSVTTGADGFFRLPALNRAGQLQLTVDDGINPAVPVIVVPNYELVQSNMDIVLT